MQSGRRELLAGAIAALAGCATPAPEAKPARSPKPPAPDPFVAIESPLGGRLGVAAIDLQSGAEIGHRESERFAMCSTFKWVLVAAILAEVDSGKLTLAREVTFGESDLLEHAPTTRANLAAGRLSVEALAQANIVNSDNTAANLLLPLVGGPEGLTAFVRKHGDTVTRFDRNEPTLNTNLPDDSRDTTTPQAMARLVKAILAPGSAALTSESRERLLGWLVASETGRARLRAGLPPDWVVGDKTGTGERSAVNDIAIATPPGRAPILIAAFFSDSETPLVKLNDGHAAVARAIVAWAHAQA